MCIELTVLCFEMLQPSDRLKTEEEIAKEEKEKLESLEVSNWCCQHLSSASGWSVRFLTLRAGNEF